MLFQAMIMFFIRILTTNDEYSIYIENLNNNIKFVNEKIVEHDNELREINQKTNIAIKNYNTAVRLYNFASGGNSRLKGLAKKKDFLRILNTYQEALIIPFFDAVESAILAREYKMKVNETKKIAFELVNKALHSKITSEIFLNTTNYANLDAQKREMYIHYKALILFFRVDELLESITKAETISYKFIEYIKAKINVKIGLYTEQLNSIYI
ncbi:hypothetical protein EDEG_03529, partial [Edhazardia aedis USNM 41457]